MNESDDYIVFAGFEDDELDFDCELFCDIDDDDAVDYFGLEDC